MIITDRYVAGTEIAVPVSDEVVVATCVTGAERSTVFRIGRARKGGCRIGHATVRHSPDESGRREWARDDDGDGIREVHCNSCEGATTGLRTYLRGFRGVHKKYLALYVATYETMRQAKRISIQVIQRMCFTHHLPHSDHT